MSETSRIELLTQMLADDPGNSFARYGLAMEHVKTGGFSSAIAEFEQLLSKDPSYAAAYYHGGQAAEKLGDLDRARDFYNRGLTNTRDAHARSEIQAALDLLP